ncbi:MAG: DNA/RNA nuclease SfsA [Amphiplicatus sp.]
MRLPAPLFPGRLVRRYKRFLADIRLDSGETVVAHCANPGSMAGVAVEGAPVWASKSDNPARKLAWSWELVDIDGVLVGINTANPNRIAAEAIRAGAVPALAGYRTLRREVKYGAASRIDLLLEDGQDGRPCYVEIKNVHLSRAPGLAEFPDAVTARGAKHLEELAAVAREGARAVMLFVVQRGDCAAFRPAADIDPDYAEGLRRAVAAGVETLCYDCAVSLDAVTLRRPLPMRLS